MCYGGLDLASTTDITGVRPRLSARDRRRKCVIAPWFWIPKDNIEQRVNRDHAPYDLWERQGFLQTGEGDVVHYAGIETFVEQLGERLDIREIAFD